MEPAVHELADRIVARLKAYAVPPISLRSPLELTAPWGPSIQHVRINELIAAEEGTPVGGGGVCASVSLDGWHYSRAELDAFKDPAEAHRRRGAAFTFNAESYTAFVESLRVTPPPESIPFPTFSHALKDPATSLHPILPHHRVIVIEGLYTLIDVPPWSGAVKEMDELVWIELDDSIAKERLIRRHMASWPDYTEEMAKERAESSDMLNGAYIREHMAKPTFTVQSVDDPAFAALAST
ncbi:hypothetical protein MNV49_002005 [Pseudohyphozyma bogoriensis]|nr:hypothetical protein MNV49_002005 [Pseudohyphozyma bogoriensis]